MPPGAAGGFSVTAAAPAASQGQKLLPGAVSSQRDRIASSIERRRTVHGMGWLI